MKMGKGSGRRPQNISDEELEKNWNALFHGHPNEGQFDKEDDYGNELPESKDVKEKPKTNDPDRFIDDIGDA
jgi:hypothetical protein